MNTIVLFVLLLCVCSLVYALSYCVKVVGLYNPKSSLVFYELFNVLKGSKRHQNPSLPLQDFKRNSFRNYLLIAFANSSHARVSIT